MVNYRLLDRALIDLDVLYENGILSFGLQQADEYYDGIIEQFELLVHSPRLYRERWEVKPPVRICPYGSHVILYTIEQEQVVIVRVRHEREDWQ